MKRDGTLVDLATPTHSYGTNEGCPPMDGACDDVMCDSGECVPVWNGGVCSCDGDTPLCESDGESLIVVSDLLLFTE